MANIPGTTIPKSILNLLPEDYQPGGDKDLAARLARDIARGDSRGANDALFTIAYFTKKDPETGQYGRGQGNPNVSKVHSGEWEVTAEMDSDASWAEQAVNSSNDVYVQHPGSKADTGGGTESGDDIDARSVTWEDGKGVFVGGVSTGSWGGLAHTEQGEGSKYFDPAYSGGGIGDPGGINKPDVGVEGGVPIDPVVSGGYTIDDFGGLLTGDHLTDTSGDGLVASSPMDYLAYRPGSKKYWSEYMSPGLEGSLMKMRPQTDFSSIQTQLGYLPGEQRDAPSWLRFLGMGGKTPTWEVEARGLDKQFQGAIPQGVWTTPAGMGALTNKPGREYPGAPWAYAAKAAPSYKMPAWTPHDISKSALGDWRGLLSDWAAPELNTTNLLGAA